MNNDTFWGIIDKIGWAQHCKDREYPDMVKRHLLWGMSPRELVDFAKEMDAKRGALHTAIRNWEEVHTHIELGGDAYGDLMHHIIGCGREVYYATLEDPSLAKVRADTYDFEESFGYCIPYLSDYELLSPSHYNRNKYELEQELEAFYEERRKDFSREALMTVAELSKLLHGYAWSAADVDRILELAPRVRELMHWHHGVDNLATDYRRFKLPVPQQYAHLSALC